MVPSPARRCGISLQRLLLRPPVAAAHPRAVEPVASPSSPPSAADLQGSPTKSSALGNCTGGKSPSGAECLASPPPSVFPAWLAFASHGSVLLRQAVVTPSPFSQLTTRPIHVTSETSPAPPPPPAGPVSCGSDSGSDAAAEEEEVNAPPEDPAAAEVESETSALARSLYRALLVRVREVKAEIQRYGHSDIFSAVDLGWLQDNVPGATAALKQGYLESFLQVQFRKPAASRQVVEARLDAAVGALSILSRRLQLLQLHAVHPYSDSLSHGVRVTVQSHFNTLDHGRRMGAIYHYTVKLKNEACEEPVQLVSRHWIISDFEGQVQEVMGPGVVGQQPVLELGKSFEYTSFTPLHSKRGTMQGSFSMLAKESGQLFEVEVKPFALISPS